MTTGLTREQVEWILSGQNMLASTQQQLLETDAALRARVEELEQALSTLRASQQQATEREAVLVGAMKEIAEPCCYMPWGIKCTKTTNGEDWCAPCLAQRALEGK